MAFNVAEYRLPVDGDGNVQDNPLMWLLPPPCHMHRMTPERRACFSRLIAHIILSRLGHDGHELGVASIGVMRPLAQCRTQTQHEYVIHFNAEPRWNVDEDGRDLKRDILAAMPLGVRDIKVSHSIEQLPLTAEEAGNVTQKQIEVHYIVHCEHNVRTAGRTMCTCCDISSLLSSLMFKFHFIFFL